MKPMIDEETMVEKVLGSVAICVIMLMIWCI